MTYDIFLGNDGAEFSPCRTWRYALWRMTGVQDRRAVTFTCLNPSTADETQNDPTVRRCIDFTRRWGYGRFVMLNLFAFRATDPSDMRAAAAPIGPGNDEALARYSSLSSLNVVAWGNHGDFMGRADRAAVLLEGPLYCLGRNKDGSPKHPLYIAAKTEPQTWCSSFGEDRVGRNCRIERNKP